MTSGVAITLFVIGIVAAIMLHEAGHFLTARWFGMRADRFFFGFGPTLWSFRPGETEYGVKLLPLGGFVRIKGMSPADTPLAPVADTVFDPETVAVERRDAAATAGVDVTDASAIPEATWRRLDAELSVRGTPRALRERILNRTRKTAGPDTAPRDARVVLHEVLVTEVSDTDHPGDLHHRLVHGDAGRLFPDRPAWQRAVVLAAGSAVHFVIAVLLLLGGFLFVPQPTGEVSPVVSEVLADTPAAASGLQPGDRIVAVAQRRTSEFDDIRSTIQARAGEPTTFVVERGGEEVTIALTPERVRDDATGEYVGVAGFVPSLVEARLAAGDALYQTFIGPGSVPALAAASIRGLVQVFGPDGLGQILAQVGGEVERDAAGAATIVGLTGLAGEGTAEYGVMFLIVVLASINIFVGVFNILPLPPLDGGHLAVLAIEETVNAVHRRRAEAANFKIDPRAIVAVALPVLVVLGTVMVALLWLDITNPIRLPTP